MRLLVTGGCGFIGGHFVDLALREGHTVVDLDCLTYAADPEAHAGSKNYERFVIDIAKVPHNALRDIDAVIHFAAESHVDNSIAGPSVTVSTNVLGTLNILGVAKELGVRVVHISTDEVTGPLEARQAPTDELSPIRCSSPYSASKAAAELLARAYHRTYGLDVVVVRMTNVYGPRQHPEKLIPRAITYALSDKPIKLFAEGTQVRDWMHVIDAVDGIWLALKRGRPGEVYCLGARNEQTNKEIVGRVAQRFGAAIAHVADRPGHDFRYATDPTKANEELAFNPVVDFNDGLNDTMTWYEAHGDWWKKQAGRGGAW